MRPGWRSLIWVLSMPVGYGVACAVMATAFISVFIIPSPTDVDLLPDFSERPLAAAVRLASMIVQATLIGGVLASPVAVPVMIFFRGLGIRRPRAYAIGGAGVVAGAALMLHLLFGFRFTLFQFGVLLACGPVAGLAYWLLAASWGPPVKAAPPAPG